MEIYPCDLDTERYLTLLRRRLSPLTWASTRRGQYATANQTPGKTPRGAKRLLKHWTAGLNLPADRNERVGQVLWNSAPVTSSRFAWVFLTAYFGFLSIIINQSGGGAAPVPGIFFGIWAVMTTALLVSPKINLRRAHHRALEESEIDAVASASRGRLDAAYLNLLRDVMRTEVASPTSREQIRAALRALGGAIAALPADRPQAIDARAMLEQVQEMRTQAAREPDLVVRESLIRHAQALEDRALTADEAARIAKRVQTLRREVRDQIDSLRSLLLLNDETAAVRREAAVQHLTETVQTVARDAHAHTLAHHELLQEDLTGLMDMKARPAAPVQAAVPVGAPQPEQVVQQVGQGGRSWWRGA